LSKNIKNKTVAPDEAAECFPAPSMATRSAEALPQPNQVICILGMHRSGTSCLTGSLQQANLFLGKHHTWNRYNRKGNRENQDIVDLHDEVLGTNNGGWNAPVAKCVWSDDQLTRLRELLAVYSEFDRFGFKDPRTLLVLSGWKRVVRNLQFIGIFRHPAAVAASLKKRDAMPTADAVELWYQYNLRLLKQYLQKPFPVLSFDASEIELTRTIAEAARQIGLDPPADRNPFYSKELRHHEPSDHQALPLKVTLLYKFLRFVSLKP
jgi:hypothetical protein